MGFPGHFVDYGRGLRVGVRLQSSVFTWRGSQHDHPLPSTCYPTYAIEGSHLRCSRWPRCLKARKTTRSSTETSKTIQRLASCELIDRTQWNCWAFRPCPGHKWWLRWRLRARFAVFARKFPSVGAVTSLPSIPDAALNARYVDYVVRGQGEETLLELIDALRGKRPLDSVKAFSTRICSACITTTPSGQ